MSALIASLAMAVSVDTLPDETNSTCVTRYERARATSSGGVFSAVVTVDKGVIKYNDTTAAAGTMYYYKVRAVAGSEYSAYTSEVSGKGDLPRINANVRESGQRIAGLKGNKAMQADRA